MQAETVKKTINAGARAAQVGVGAARMKEQVTQAVEEGMTAARRTVRRGRYAAEDMLEETSHYIKRHPIETVAVTFGLGLATGLLAGILARSRRPTVSDDEG